MRRVHDQEHSSEMSVPEHLGPAFRDLLCAYELAADACCDCWAFAVEIQSVIETVDRSHLRWLVKKGYFSHARETTKAGDADRQFLKDDSLKFSKRSCFVLTERGVAIARQLGDGDRARHSPEPKWDGCRHELTVGDKLVKKFKLPSRNQETILAAFEEEGWPLKIDDPLPPHPEIDPKRRLHDTIKGLNRNQKMELIRFLGDGTGEAVTWELCQIAIDSHLSDDTGSRTNGSGGH